MNGLAADARRAVRGLVRHPGFTAVALLTLALGIGANAVMFSVIDPILLRALPYRDADRLVVALRTNTSRGFASYGVSPNAFEAWREENRSFEDLAALRGVGGASLLSGDGLAPQLVEVGAASSNFFPMLGVSPILGRSFTPEEERQFAPAFSGPVCLLSYSLWQRAFGGSPAVVGRRVRLNGAAATVLGVMPPDFQFRAKHDVWVPLPVASVMHGESADVPVLAVYGHLKRGVSLAQAQADMDALAARQAEIDPVHDQGWGVMLAPLQDFYLERARARSILLLVFGIAGLVLLIGCANIAALMLVRASGRQQEFAVRLALGASRVRLVAEAMTESLVLALGGGAAGALLTLWGMPIVRRLLPALPSFRAEGAALDLSALAFTFGVSLVAAVLFGLAPALRRSKADLSDALKLGGARGGPGESAGRVRRALVVFEFAVAVLVVVSAGLAIRTLMALERVNPGLDPDRALTLALYCPLTRYPTEHDVSVFAERLDAQLKTVPGVEATALTISPPLNGLFVTTAVVPEGRGTGRAGENPEAVITTATPDYFRALDVPLLAGRFFDRRDMDGAAPRAVIVSARLARLLWTSTDPVGQRVRLGDDSAAPLDVVVGVVSDLHHESLGTPANLEVYTPVYRGAYWEPRTLIVRAAGDPAALARAVQAAVAAVDPDQPANQPTPMTDLLSASLSRQRFSGLLLGAAGLLALGLAAVGIYGVVSFAAAQRTREIGIRLTLGATPSDVLGMIIGQNLMLAVTGVAIGLGASAALTRVMSGLLYGVAPTDAWTFGAVSVILLGVALMACYLPASRAARVEPIDALRCR